MPGKPRTIDTAKRGVPFADPARNASVIQAAIDELAKTLTPGAAGVVLLPDDDVIIDRPIFLDADRVGLEGRGKGVSRLIAANGHDILTLIRRRPVTEGGLQPPPSADHFPPGLAGHIAFRTKADTHLATQGGPLDTFPAGVTALAVDLCLDLSRLTGTVGNRAVSVCGLTGGSADPSPWEIVLGGDQCVFRMQSATGQIVQANFPIGAKPGVVRLTVQVDLGAGKVSTWVDDKPVANTGVVPADFTQFAANQHAPFGIGSNSLRANGVADWFGGAQDITFLGLRVSREVLYKPDGPLARLDGAAVDDSRYFTPNPPTMGYLALQDKPADVMSSRVMVVTGLGYTPTTAYCLDNVAHLTPYSTVAPGPIRHLSLVSRSRYGRGIAVGYALGLRVEDCEVFGGRDGIGSINFGATYPVTILDCDLAGEDSPLYLNSASTVVIDRVNLPSAFRCGFRLVDSYATIRNVFAPCWGTSQNYIRAFRSSFVLEDSTFDNEGFQGAQEAPIYCQPGGVFPIICSVRRCGFASYSKDAPLVRLEDADPAAFPHAMKFTIEDCPDVIRAGTAKIDARGSRWKVVKDW